MECSSSAPPPACARSERQELWPGTTCARRPVLVVAQRVSHRSVPARPELTAARSSAIRGWKREWNPTWAGQTRPPHRVTELLHAASVGRQRLLAEQGLSGLDDCEDEFAVRGRRRGHHHRVDFGITDDVGRVGCRTWRTGSCGDIALALRRRVRGGHRHTTSSSASFFRPSAWIWPIIPHPTRPILSGLSIDPRSLRRRLTVALGVKTTGILSMPETKFAGRNGRSSPDASAMSGIRSSNLLEHDPQLEPRQLVPETEMRPEAECDVIVRGSSACRTPRDDRKQSSSRLAAG